MIVFSVCLLIFAGDTRHAASLPFRWLCGLSGVQNVFRRDGACPVSEGKDTEILKSVIKMSITFKNTITFLSVFLCFLCYFEKICIKSYRKMYKILKITLHLQDMKKTSANTIRINADKTNNEHYYSLQCQRVT